MVGIVLFFKKNYLDFSRFDKDVLKMIFKKLSKRVIG